MSITLHAIRLRGETPDRNQRWNGEDFGPGNGRPYPDRISLELAYEDATALYGPEFVERCDWWEEE